MLFVKLCLQMSAWQQVGKRFLSSQLEQNTVKLAKQTLRSVPSPVVAAGAMEMGGKMKQWAVGRQAGLLPQPDASSPAVLGVSAFAFQGTNAHAVVQAAGFGGSSMAKPVASGWAKQRFWVAVKPHAGIDLGTAFKQRLALQWSAH